jgi:hypothetical protein
MFESEFAVGERTLGEDGFASGGRANESGLESRLRHAVAG